MSARKYSKTQGAFTSVDALWAGQVDYSPYAYAFHNPINFMDPTGYSGTPIGGGSGGSGGGTAGVPGQITTKEVVVWGDPDAWYWYNYFGIDGQIRDSYRTQQQIWLSESTQRANESKQLPGQNYLPKSSAPSMAPPEQSIGPTSPHMLQQGNSKPFDWMAMFGNTNGILGVASEASPDVVAQNTGHWVDANGLFNRLAYRGNQHVSATVIAQQKASSIARAKFFGRLGKASAILGIGLILYDAGKNGLKASHVADVIIMGALYGLSVALPGVGLAISVLYLTADIITFAATGKSITQNLFDD